MKKTLPSERFRVCRRCGTQKPPPNDRSSVLCVACRAETDCRHFISDGMDPKCAAGVDIAALTAPLEGSILRRPCYFINHDATPVKCDKFCAFTQDEVRDIDEATQRAIARTMLAMSESANVKQQYRGRDWSGSVPCPACGGVLHLSHSSVNGHVHGRCETAGCVSWME